MRLPAYAKGLIAARAAGREPWLVSVAIGLLQDRAVLAGQKGVARIGWGDAATVHQAQWAVLVGANVLLSLFVDEAARDYEPFRRVVEPIWLQGKPGTLWLSNGASANYLSAWPRRGGGVDFDFSAEAFPLNAGFRAEVDSHRKVCLVVGDGLFARPEFEPVREVALASRLSSHDATG